MQQIDVKLTYAQVLESLTVLNLLGRERMAFIYGIAMSDNRKALAATIDNYNEHRKEIYKKYVKLDEAGDFIFKAENQVIFKSEEDEFQSQEDTKLLNGMEVTVKLYTFTRKEMESSGVMAENGVWDALGWMVQEPAPEPAEGTAKAQAIAQKRRGRR